MAQQSDGTIYIDTKIGTEGFEAGGKEIEAAARRMAKSVSGIGDAAKIALQKQADALVKQNQMFAQQKQKVESLKANLKELGEAKIPTDSFKSLEAEAQRLEDELDQIYKKQQEFISLGFSENDSYKMVADDLERVSLKLDEVYEKQKRMKSQGTAYVDPAGTDAYRSTESKLSYESQKLQSMNNKLGTSYESLKEKVHSYGEETSILTGIKNRFTKVIGKMSSWLKRAASSLLGLNKNTKNTRISLLKMLGTSLLFSTVFRAISLVTGGIKEGIQNLAQYSSSANASLSSLMSALTQLKNSFATAFSPIFTAVAPAITSLINMLSRAITYIGMFVAALTGAKSFTRAKSVQQDYAGSISKTSTAANNASGGLKKAAKATDDLAKATKEAKKENEDYLSGLDEVKKFTSQKDSSDGGGGSGGGGGGGAGGGGGIGVGDMFETVPVDSAISDFAERLKELFANQDYEGIGLLIANGLNKAMKKVDDWINNTFRPMGVKWAKIIARILNGLVDGLDWTLLGKTIADGLNAAFDIVNTFLSTFNFEKLGNKVSEALNSIFKTLDAKLIGTTLANYINAAIDFAYGLVEPFDWITLGKKIAEGADAFFSQIKLTKAATAVGKLFVGIVAAILTAIPGVVQAMTDAGVKMMDGLSKGISDNITNFIDMAFPMLVEFSAQLRENAGQLVDSGLNLILQIAQGLINGIPTLIETIPSIISNIAGIINDNAPKLLIAGAKLILMLASGLIQAIPTLIANIPAIISAIIDVFMAYNWISLGRNIMNLFKDGIAKMKSVVVKTTKGVYTGIVNIIKALPSQLKSLGTKAFQNIVNAIKGKLPLIKTSSTGVFNGILNALKSLPSKLLSLGKEAFSNIVKAISGKLGSITSAAGKVLSGIVNSLKNLPSRLQKIASTAISNMKSKFTSGGWSAIGRNIVNGIVGGILGAAYKLYDTLRSLAKKALGAAQKAIDSHSPSRLFRDKIGKMIPAGITVGVEDEFKNTFSTIKSLSGKLVNTSERAVSGIKYPSVPYLATGTVIPPQASIKASGMQTDTDVVNAFKRALTETLAKNKTNVSSAGSTYKFIGQINRRTLFEEVITEAKARQTNTGRNPFELA